MKGESTLRTYNLQDPISPRNQGFRLRQVSHQKVRYAPLTNTSGDCSNASEANNLRDQSCSLAQESVGLVAAKSLLEIAQLTYNHGGQEQSGRIYLPTDLELEKMSTTERSSFSRLVKFCTRLSRVGLLSSKSCKYEL